MMFVTFSFRIFYIGIGMMIAGVRLSSIPKERFHALISELLSGELMPLHELTLKSDVTEEEAVSALNLLKAAVYIQRDGVQMVKLSTPCYKTLHGKSQDDYYSFYTG